MATDSRAVTIPERFCGPPGRGNGGFSCGAFAAALEGPAQVTLRQPIPLEQPLRIEPDRGTDAFRVLDAQGDLTAEVRPAEPLVELEVPAVPTPEEAGAASADSPFRGPNHAYPECFVCGPRHPDGLRIHVGTLEAGGEVAADSFTIGPELAGEDGAARPEVVWAALDCPSYVPAYWGEVPVLLGRLTVERLASVPVGAPLVALSWPLGDEGRKLHSASALLDADGTELARARALWIRLRQPLSG